MTAPQTTSASYEVGYRKPPRRTQFQKGQSGNPGGRPRRAKRLEELALHEAYRPTIVMVDGRAEPMPAIQAVLRRQLQIAAGGNVRAQRDILAMIRDIELVRSITSRFENGGDDDVADDDDDVVDTDDDADDAEAIDGDDNEVDDTADADAIDSDVDDVADASDSDVDDTADADCDDAGSADEPARQQADRIDTSGERRQAETKPRASFPPPLAGEGRVGALAESPYRGVGPVLGPSPSSGRVAERSEVGWGPSARPCRGEGPTPALHPKSDLSDFGIKPVEIGNSRFRLDGEGEPARASFPPRGVRPRRDGPERSAGAEPARPQPGRRRRSPAVNAGKIREGRCGSSRRSPGRTNAAAGPAQAAGGHARAPAAPAERGEKLKIRC
jgi:hypothetical protein